MADDPDIGSGQWAAPAVVDVYHGKVRCKDNQVFWVVPRLHFRSGWAVEIRMGSANGPIVERLWQPHRTAARALVNRLRIQLAHAATVDEVVTRSMLPAPPRGIVVVHGAHGGRFGTSCAAVDGGPSAPTCCTIWAEPGLRVVRWLFESTVPSNDIRQVESARLEVTLQQDTTCHVAQLLRTWNRPVIYGDHSPLGHHHSLQ